MESNCFSIEDLRIDGLPSGKLFCASVCPSFSWRMISLYPGTMQESYRIVAKNADSEELLWDSGIVDSLAWQTFTFQMPGQMASYSY